MTKPTDANHLSAKNAAVMVSVTKGRVDIISDDADTPQHAVEHSVLPRMDTNEQSPQPTPDALTPTTPRHIVPVKRPL